MIQYLLICISCIFCFSFSWCSVHAEGTDPAICLIDSTGKEHLFPSYLKKVSPVIHHLLTDSTFKESAQQRIDIKDIDGDTLGELKEALLTISKCARSNHGEVIDPNHSEEYPNASSLCTEDNKIHHPIIWVHSLVKEALSPRVSSLSNDKLCQLFLASHFLEIEPLINAYAHFIAYRLDPNQEPTKPFNGFAEEQWLYIQKHLHLKKLNIAEKSVADYFGMNGQPLLERGCINLSDLQITNLEGLEHIASPEQIREINLEQNCILGMDLNPLFPTRPFEPFSSLHTLYLNSNHIHTWPPTLFESLPNLWSLHMEKNGISSLPRAAFHHIPKLQFLYLGDNGLLSIDENAFIDMPKLEHLHLEHNHLSSLPIEQWGKQLPWLSQLSVRDNQFTHSIEEKLLVYLPRFSQLNMTGNPMEDSNCIFINIPNMGVAGNRTRQLQAATLGKLPAI